jgi:hypothetical protein
VENNLRAGEKSKADRVIDSLFSVCQVTTLKTLLANSEDRDRQVPYSTALLAPVIAAKLRTESNRLLVDDRLEGGQNY